MRFISCRFELIPDLGDVETIVANLQSQGLPAGTGFRGFHKRSKRRCRKPVQLSNSAIAAEQTLLISHPVLLHEQKDFGAGFGVFETGSTSCIK